MSTTYRHYWFRFSLRTMLVLVVVLCIYLGWAMNWIRQRREFSSLRGVNDNSDVLLALKGEPIPPAPLPIRILGENEITYLLITGNSPFNNDVDPEQIETAKRLFPEARVGVAVSYRSHGIGLH